MTVIVLYPLFVTLSLSLLHHLSTVSSYTTKATACSIMTISDQRNVLVSKAKHRSKNCFLTHASAKLRAFRSINKISHQNFAEHVSGRFVALIVINMLCERNKNGEHSLVDFLRRNFF